MSHSIRSTFFLTFALCLGGTLAHAQDASVFFGGGYATDGSVGSSFDAVTGNPENAPSLNATFGKIGGDFMFNKNYGAGFNVDFPFASTNYLGLNTRPIFYDFDGVYVPFSSKWTRVVPEIQAGLGGVRMNFSYASCDNIGGCQSSLVESSTHFQLHVGVGVRLYATKHIFIRPAFDYHWVNNFFQYGSNSVPEFGAAVGWSFSEH